MMLHEATPDVYRIAEHAKRYGMEGYSPLLLAYLFQVSASAAGACKTR